MAELTLGNTLESFYSVKPPFCGRVNVISQPISLDLQVFHFHFLRSLWAMTTLLKCSGERFVKKKGKANLPFRMQVIEQSIMKENLSPLIWKQVRKIAFEEHFHAPREGEKLFSRLKTFSLSRLNVCLRRSDESINDWLIRCWMLGGWAGFASRRSYCLPP